MKSHRLVSSVVRKLERIAKTYGDDYALDLAVSCKACGADVTVKCKGLAPGIVHIGRRIRRLLRGTKP